MSSQTQIANAALRCFGQSRVTDVNEGSVAALAILDVWDMARRAALRAFPWNFATKPAELTAAATAPLFRWSKSFPLPEDYLRLLTCNGEKPGAGSACFEIQGKSLMSNSSTAQIEYTADIPNTATWDDQFIDAFAYMLASKVATSMMADGGQAAALMAQRSFEEALKAMSSNSIETRPRVISALSGSKYLAARAEGSDGWDWHNSEALPETVLSNFNPWNVPWP